jgi:nucleotide-binding universal stress UspA family protein
MKPLQTIAVGFDGSDDSKAAVRWAFEMADRLGSDVVLVHAVGLLQRSRIEEVTDELRETVRRLTGECGFDHGRVHLHVANGDPCSVLLRSKDAPLGADLIVVGSRGQGEHAGLLLGSTSLQLAEHSSIPVVVVPSQHDEG